MAAAAARSIWCGMALLLAVPAAGRAEPRTPACDAALQEVNATIAAGDVDRLMARHDALVASGACPDDEVNAVLDALGGLAIRTVASGLAEGREIQAFAELLARFERRPDGPVPGDPVPLGEPRNAWLLYYYLGLQRQAEGEWSLAAHNFERALRQSEDISATDDERVADRAWVAEIHRRYQDSMLLADDYLVEGSTRDGAAATLAIAAFRSGATIVRVAVPVQYEYGSSQFTDRGSRSADRLAEIVAQTREPVTIVGHTDERGSAAYNYDLSLRRAERLRDHLVAAGYPVELISVEGRGEDCPYPSADPALLDPSSEHGQELIWQLDRRAEIVWPERAREPEQPSCRE